MTGPGSQPDAKLITAILGGTIALGIGCLLAAVTGGPVKVLGAAVGVAARQGLSWSLRADCGERAEPGGAAGRDGGGDEPGGAGQGEVGQQLAGG